MIKRARAGLAAVATVLCAAGGVAAAGAPAGASAAGPGFQFIFPGNLLVSESFYTNDPNIVAGQTELPPGCTGANCVTATANGTYPQVFNNASAERLLAQIEHFEELDDVAPFVRSLAGITS